MGQIATTSFRARFVARKVVPLLQVFDCRSKTRNILPQQKIAKILNLFLTFDVILPTILREAPNITHVTVLIERSVEITWEGLSFKSFAWAAQG